MLKISLINLWSRRRRMLGTFLAVFLGVAFLSGTLALGDTLSANFDTLFSRVTRGTDVVVRGATNVSSGSSRATRGPVDQQLVPAVAGVAGVAEGAEQHAPRHYGVGHWRPDQAASSASRRSCARRSSAVKAVGVTPSVPTPASR